MLDTAVIAMMLRQSLSEGQHPHLTIISDSMAPLLRTGDKVQLSQATANDLQTGDIAVFETDHVLMTHRFWGRMPRPDGPRLVTRGDRPMAFDPPWDPNQLVGRVTARQRRERQLTLDRGPGQYLNRLIAFLLRGEHAFLIRFRPPTGRPPTDLEWAGFVTYTNYFKERRWTMRLTRRLVYVVNSLLTSFVSAFAAIGQPGGSATT